MSAKKAVVEYLKAEPKFRERSSKDRGIVNLLMRRYSGLTVAIASGAITKEQVVAMVQDYASMDRAWRQALEHDVSLRGADYGDKERLEQEHKVSLGYGDFPPVRQHA